LWGRLAACAPAANRRNVNFANNIPEQHLLTRTALYNHDQQRRLFSLQFSEIANTLARIGRPPHYSEPGNAALC